VAITIHPNPSGRRDGYFGDGFGLADATVAHYVLRMEQMGMTPMIAATATPHLNDWFNRVYSLPSYRIAVDNRVIPGLAGMLREKGEKRWPDVERILRGL
jgi:glutathione S-transferase